MKKDRCICCGTFPVVIESDDPEYPFVLKHQDTARCMPEHKLTVYHRSPEECIERWNEFNRNSDKMER